MSKPKFQTEWEEIDEEYQQLQVTQSRSATSSRVSPLAFLAPAARHGSSCVTLDSSFPLVIHSRPGRKRSIEPLAGGNI